MRLIQCEKTPSWACQKKKLTSVQVGQEVTHAASRSTVRVFLPASDPHSELTLEHADRQ